MTNSNKKSACEFCKDKCGYFSNSNKPTHCQCQCHLPAQPKPLTRTCPKCKNSLDLSAFGWDKDGKICNGCWDFEDLKSKPAEISVSKNDKMYFEPLDKPAQKECCRFCHREVVDWDEDCDGEGHHEIDLKDRPEPQKECPFYCKHSPFEPHRPEPRQDEPSCFLCRKELESGQTTASIHPRCMALYTPNAEVERLLATEKSKSYQDGKEDTFKWINLALEEVRREIRSLQSPNKN